MRQMGTDCIRRALPNHAAAVCAAHTHTHTRVFRGGTYKAGLDAAAAILDVLAEAGRVVLACLVEHRVSPEVLGSL